MGCKVSRRIKGLLVLIIFGAVVKQGKSHSTEVWVSSVLDETAMMKSGGRVWSNSTNSAIHCLAISQALEWGQASCFSKDRPGAQCQTWGDDALKSVAARWNGTVGATTCKIRQSFVRCFLEDGSYVDINGTYADDCDKVFRCTENGTKLIESLETCSDPFKETSAGCLYIESAEKDWCSARQNCKKLGGDLYTADDDEKFEKLRVYLTENDIKHEDIWVAVKKIDGVWQWIPSGHKIGAAGEEPWASGEPQDYEDCARARKNDEFKLAGIGCNPTYSSVCQVTLN